MVNPLDVRFDTLRVGQSNFFHMPGFEFLRCIRSPPRHHDRGSHPPTLLRPGHPAFADRLPCTRPATPFANYM